LQEKADFLWIKGTGKLSSKYGKQEALLNDYKLGVEKQFYGKLLSPKL
jgi:hypothetical protein